MLYKFDLHYHSNYSDGSASIFKIENKCLKEGLGLALTDHNEIKGAVKLYERGKIPIILGIEAGTKEGIEFLIYFRKIDEYIYFYKSQVEGFKSHRILCRSKNPAKNILIAAKSMDTFISLAHPYAFGKKSINYHIKKGHDFLDFVLEKIDAIEIFNGKMSKKRNLQALALQEILMKKMTLGSDGHDLKSLCDANVVTDIPNITDYNFIFNKLVNNEFVSLNSNHKLRLIKTVSVISSKSASQFLTKGYFRKKKLKNSE